jgi:hypothetical protein
MLVITTAKAKELEKNKAKNKKLLKKYWDLIYPPDMVDQMVLSRPQYDK